MMSDAFAALLGALAEAFAAEGRPGGDAAAKALREAQSQRWRARPGSADPGTLLDEAAALPGATDIAPFVIACRSRIAWTRWGEGTLAPEIAASLWSAEILGPDGHFEAEGVRVGLLVSAPDTDYPLSSHSGEETYLVIAGTAEWRIGTASAFRLPGSLVHHPAWASHGRRTLSEPFLGAWRWSGEIDLTSFTLSKDTANEI